MVTNVNLDSVSRQIDSIVLDLKELDLSVSSSGIETKIPSSQKIAPSEQLDNILNSISQALSQEAKA